MCGPEWSLHTEEEEREGQQQEEPNNHQIICIYLIKNIISESY